MEPTALDHAYAALILVVVPLLGWFTWPRALARLREDLPGVRVRLYLRGMASQWVLTGLLLALWLGRGRPLPDLGWGAGHGGVGLIAALGIAAAIAGLQVAQLVTLARSPDDHAEIAEMLDEQVPFLPRTPAEDRVFAALAVTAGLCEETLYRGFCVTWAATWLGLPGAVVATSVAFGLAHAYQGRTGVIKTTIAGLVAGTLFGLGGTLWVPAVLHAFVDLHAGTTYRVVRGTRHRPRG